MQLVTDKTLASISLPPPTSSAAGSRREHIGGQLNLLPVAEQNSNNYLVFDRVVTVLYESTSLLVTRCTLSYAGRRPEAVACLRDAPRIQRALAVDDVLYHCLKSQLPFRRLLPPLPDIDPDLDLLDCAIIGLRCVECTENKSM